MDSNKVITFSPVAMVPYHEVEVAFLETKRELNELRQVVDYLENVVGFCIGYAIPNEKKRKDFYKSIEKAIKELNEENKDAK